MSLDPHSIGNGIAGAAGRAEKQWRSDQLRVLGEAWLIFKRLDTPPLRISKLSSSLKEIMSFGSLPSMLPRLDIHTERAYRTSARVFLRANIAFFLSE